MENRINSDFEQLDHKTCQSICDAVGERLQQDIRPESWLSPDLEHLVVSCAGKTTGLICGRSEGRFQ